MYYTYEANLTYSKEDKIWYVDFPEFNGDAYTDGDTIEQAVKNAAEVLSLTLCDYIDSGIPLPKPSFSNPPKTIVCVEVNDETIALSKCITVTQAAEELGVSPGRVSQLLSSGQLETYMNGTTRMVTIASVNARKANKPPAHRPRKKTAAV